MIQEGLYIKEYFKDLKFDEESHTYTLDGNKLTSVSHMIKKYVIPFDEDKMAGIVAKKRGVTKEEILLEWHTKRDDSCALGTKVHLFGEKLLNGERLVPTNGYEEAIVKFVNMIPPHIRLVATELQMYSKEFNFAGTADMLVYNTKLGSYHIWDWKTNADLFKNFKGQTLLPPFNDILDSPFGKYNLQLSYYQLLFEQTGFNVTEKWLIWLKPDGTFSCYKTKDLKERLLDELIKK